ncbi:MAG: Bax inhibitor-1 family protein [Kofleriaceae bacterium]|nr:Bax inhibitor-1 family protein [Kofleriaceae bacterium]
MALGHSRPIEGAVATLGVSERVTFLRRTYAVLGIGLLAWAGLTFYIFRFMPEFSFKLSSWALSGRWNWAIVLGAFMVLNMIAQALARSEASRPIQYVGLAVAVIAESLILQPLITVLFWKFPSGNAINILTAASIITMLIFGGLTLTVFLTKKDFSFMRGFLTIATFAAMGVIIASLIFGFQLGAIFCGAMILLMAGYILYQTSLVMQHYPPTHYVSAALMLFSTVATLFWYVLQFIMEMSSNR